MIAIYSEHLPGYAKEYIKGFNLNYKLMQSWSFAESSHNPEAESHKNAYGRYQITIVWLDDYMRYTKQPFKNIKNIKTFLKNDKNNCYIAYWSFSFWRRYGFTAREIFQIWLFGLRNVYENKKWNYNYEKKIFGNTKPKKLSMYSYWKIVGRYD